jgi:hypothetical protein
MNLKRILFFTVAAVGLTACDDKGEVVTATLKPGAFVRFVNGVNDTLAIDFHPVDKVENGFIAVPFRGQTPYLRFEAGTRQFKAFPNSDDAVTTSTPLQDNVTLTLTAGQYYTVILAGSARAAAGSATADKITIIAETDTVSPTGANIKLRALNVDPAGPVDFFKVATTTTTPAGTPTIANVAYNQLTNYVQTATGAFAVRTTTPGTFTVLATTAAPAGDNALAGVDPIPGATIGGSRMTAIYFPASVAGSKAASFTTPGVVILTDNHVHQ